MQEGVTCRQQKGATRILEHVYPVAVAQKINNNLTYRFDRYEVYKKLIKGDKGKVRQRDGDKEIMPIWPEASLTGCYCMFALLPSI